MQCAFKKLFAKAIGGSGHEQGNFSGAWLNLSTGK